MHIVYMFLYLHNITLFTFSSDERGAVLADTNFDIFVVSCPVGIHININIE